ncbi:hypothetical protein LCGC14_1151610 [marine sediment metagenome]|uniref:Uncharacterized protein n=1 Tax=marine sediment metagenome TaxID=412755 RepID=A0A0F9PDG0_9ZZZZ
MVEQILQMGADFIEAQGMMAFVVVVLAVLMYRDQTARSKDGERQAAENKRQGDNFAIESRQQGEILKILRAEVANNAANVANNATIIANQGALISKVDELKTDLITEAQSISDASTLPLMNTMDEIMDTVTPLEQLIRELRSDIKSLQESVNAQVEETAQMNESVRAHYESSTKFRDDVTAKTAEIENRLIQVEKTATQETPVIVAVEEIKHLQATETEEQTDKVKTITTEKGGTK